MRLATRRDRKYSTEEKGEGSAYCTEKTKQGYPFYLVYANLTSMEYSSNYLLESHAYAINLGLKLKCGS